MAESLMANEVRNGGSQDCTDPVGWTQSLVGESEKKKAAQKVVNMYVFKGLGDAVQKTLSSASLDIISITKCSGDFLDCLLRWADWPGESR